MVQKKNIYMYKQCNWDCVMIFLKRNTNRSGASHFARAVAPLSARRHSLTMPTTTMSLFNARRAFVASKTSFGRAPSESDALLHLDGDAAGIQERKWLTPRRAIAVACVALVGCGIVVAGGMATKSEAARAETMHAGLGAGTSHTLTLDAACSNVGDLDFSPGDWSNVGAKIVTKSMSGDFLYDHATEMTKTGCGRYEATVNIGDGEEFGFFLYQNGAASLEIGCSAVGSEKCPSATVPAPLAGAPCTQQTTLSNGDTFWNRVYDGSTNVFTWGQCQATCTQTEPAGCPAASQPAPQPAPQPATQPAPQPATQTPQQQCEADPNRWWQASSSTCYETCFNTATACGNHISRQHDHPTECAYMTPTCARSDCTGNGLNKPGVPTCQDPQTACNAAPDAWWDTSSSKCYESCYNTASQCGNHISRDWAGMCNYNGPVCARSDNTCDGQGGNKPGAPPC